MKFYFTGWVEMADHTVRENVDEARARIADGIHAGIKKGFTNGLTSPALTMNVQVTKPERPGSVRETLRGGKLV
jgi:hypothetical protein